MAEKDNRGQEDCRAEAAGAAVKGTPLLQSGKAGKERLDCVTHSLQPLVVMHYLIVMHHLLAAAAGWDAAPDPLLHQHLTDCAPVIPLIPNHCGCRRPILPHPISAREVTALPLLQVQPPGTTFAGPDPMEPAGHAPWRTTHQEGFRPPLLRLDGVGWALRAVASSISTSGSAPSDGSGASDVDASEKSRSKTPLSEQGRQRLSRVLWGPSAGEAPTLHPVPGRSRGGWVQPAPGSAQTIGPSPMLLILSWGSLSAERVTPYMVIGDQGDDDDS